MNYFKSVYAMELSHRAKIVFLYLKDHQGEGPLFLWTEDRFMVNPPESLTLRNI